MACSEPQKLDSIESDIKDAILERAGGKRNGKEAPDIQLRIQVPGGDGSTKRSKTTLRNMPGTPTIRIRVTPVAEGIPGKRITDLRTERSG